MRSLGWGLWGIVRLKVYSVSVGGNFGLWALYSDSGAQGQPCVGLIKGIGFRVLGCRV